VLHTSFGHIQNGFRELCSAGILGNLNVRFLNEEFFRWVLGLLRLNTHVVTIASPLREYAILIENLPEPHRGKNISELLPQVMRIHERFSAVAEAEKMTAETENSENSESEESEDDDEESISLNWVQGLGINTRIFPGNVGSGFFPKISMLNHTCMPNAEIAFLENNSAVITTTRRVKQGEEILITYVDAEAEFQKRKEDLKDYGFICTCKKCKAQE